MELDFTIGLTEGISWPWPIAVYLFLAGISGGAVAAVLMLNLYRRQTHVNTPALKAASLIGASTILLGMVCLVLDLTNPLNFWRILIHYNVTSVMSLGVMALLVYIPAVCLLMLVAFRDRLSTFGLGFLDPLVGGLDARRHGLSWLTLIMALTICAYTGFLISALIRFPLINQAVLPALFVASGLSAGMAATKAMAVGCFGDHVESGDQHLMHGAVIAFTDGVWATEFWVGVIGVGFILPLLFGLMKQSRAAFYMGALASVVGMMCLRLFILYAGQLNGL